MCLINVLQPQIFLLWQLLRTLFDLLGNCELKYSSMRPSLWKRGSLVSYSSGKNPSSSRRWMGIQHKLIVTSGRISLKTSFCVVKCVHILQGTFLCLVLFYLYEQPLMSKVLEWLQLFHRWGNLQCVSGFILNEGKRIAVSWLKDPS